MANEAHDFSLTKLTPEAFIEQFPAGEVIQLWSAESDAAFRDTMQPRVAVEVIDCIAIFCWAHLDGYDGSQADGYRPFCFHVSEAQSSESVWDWLTNFTKADHDPWFLVVGGNESSTTDADYSPPISGDEDEEEAKEVDEDAFPGAPDPETEAGGWASSTLWRINKAFHYAFPGNLAPERRTDVLPLAGEAKVDVAVNCEGKAFYRVM